MLLKNNTPGLVALFLKFLYLKFQANCPAFVKLQQFIVGSTVYTDTVHVYVNKLTVGDCLMEPDHHRGLPQYLLQSKNMTKPSTTSEAKDCKSEAKTKDTVNWP